MISSSEDGIQIRYCKNSQDLLEHFIDDNNGRLEFLDKIPSDIRELGDLEKDRFIIIKGEIVIPKPKQFIQFYEVE